MRFLGGTRLYIRALEKLLKCKEIDRVFLDTESEEMYKLADFLPIEFMKRDPKLADNSTDGHKMFLNELNSYPDADIYVQLLCTSPFIEPETIDAAIKLLKEGENDSAVLMKKDRYYFWRDNAPLYDKQHIPNSVTLPETVTESMGLYIITKSAALKTGRRFGDNPHLIFGKLHELIDVNNHEDLVFAETYAKGEKQREIALLNLYKHFITSPALSDILDDMELENKEPCGGYLKGFEANFPAILFGRANTLKLRRLREGEDFKGIYKALESYQGVTENDIIIVENECADFAYFGDLNARLAIRQGAAGAVIGGATRDKKATSNLFFPVFSKGYNSSDVRRRAVLDYINKPVVIDGLKISPKDLIFADEGGVVVIYQKYEKEVLARALDTFKNEHSINFDILSEKGTDEIILRHGNF